MNPLKSFFGTLSVSDTSITQNARESLYDISINSLQGRAVNLSDFKGKKILIVNVASKCGFTPQYKELQHLHNTYKDQLAVIGVPCNQIGKQEPGSSSDISTFCEQNYGVDFLITEKVDVKGPKQHPLYTWLTQKAYNGRKDSSVKWNFQKYLIDEKGELINYFYSITKPTNSRITSNFQ